MRIRSASDLISTVIAWLPLLLVLTGVVLALGQTGLFLEVNSDGTEVFLPNDASVEHWNRIEVQQHQQAQRELGLD